MLWENSKDTFVFSFWEVCFYSVGDYRMPLYTGTHMHTVIHSE